MWSDLIRVLSAFTFTLKLVHQTHQTLGFNPNDCWTQYPHCQVNQYSAAQRSSSRPEVCLVFCAHLMLFQRHPGVEPIELTDQGSSLRGEVALLGLQLLLSQIGTFWLLSLKKWGIFSHKSFPVDVIFPRRWFFPGFFWVESLDALTNPYRRFGQIPWDGKSQVLHHLLIYHLDNLVIMV